MLTIPHPKTQRETMTETIQARVEDFNRRVVAAHLAHCANGTGEVTADDNGACSRSLLLQNQRVWSLFSTGHIMNECGEEIHLGQPRKQYRMEARELSGHRLLNDVGLKFQLARPACNNETYAYLTEKECTTFRAEMHLLVKELLLAAVQSLNERVRAAHHAHYAANPPNGLIRRDQSPNENKIYHFYTDGSVTNQKGSDVYGRRNEFVVLDIVCSADTMPFEFVLGTRKQYAILTESECRTFREEMLRMLT